MTNLLITTVMCRLLQLPQILCLVPRLVISVPAAQTFLQRLKAASRRHPKINVMLPT